MAADEEQFGLGASYGTNFNEYAIDGSRGSCTMPRDFNCS